MSGVGDLLIGSAAKCSRVMCLCHESLLSMLPALLNWAPQDESLVVLHVRCSLLRAQSGRTACIWQCVIQHEMTVAMPMSAQHSHGAGSQRTLCRPPSCAPLLSGSSLASVGW